MKNRLKELRARDGMNQTELAKRAKVSRQTISLIERNEYMPSLLIATKKNSTCIQQAINKFLCLRRRN